MSIGEKAFLHSAPAAVAWRVGLSNLPFLVALGLNGVLPAFIQAIVVGAILFLAPGLAWTNRSCGDAPVVLFRAVVTSLIAALVVSLVLIPFGGSATNRISFLILLAIVTNVGLWIGLQRGWYRDSPFRPSLPRLLSVVAALFYIQSFIGATHFVPPLEDQDMETQGTAYGLMHRFLPTMVTNRGTLHFLAHPLLLHFWIGESALISGDLDRLRYYHEAALATPRDPQQMIATWRKEFAQFKADPVLLPTRTPNLFLSALVLFPLGFLIYRLSGSRVAAVGACVVYATLPEVYVRSSYGGYFAITNFLLTSGSYFYLQASGLLPARADIGGGSAAPVGRWAWVAAFLGGWADQKFLLLPLTAPLHAGLRVLSDLRQQGAESLRALAHRLAQRPDAIAAFLIVSGFVAGWAMFALYGLTVAPGDFVADHLNEHIWSRIKGAAHVKLLGGRLYPSVVALWHQYANHTGWLLVPPMLLGFWRASQRPREAEGMLMIWILIGAIGFSLIDWRQTKHLAHLLPALVTLAAVYWAFAQGRLQSALSALIGVAVLWNLWRIGQLMNDFYYLLPRPDW
jgi:hypothetical protein